MRVGFLQFEPRLGDSSFNLCTIRRCLEGAVFDLMVLPELSISGYLLGSRDRARKCSEPVPDGPTTLVLMAIARERSASMVAGLVERAGEQVYNCAVLVGPNGLLHRHRKVHLPRYELPIFDPGDSFDVVAIGGATIGIAMCFDSWLPEACRRLTLRGADVLCSPANFGGPWSAEMARVRALENVCFVISANRIGSEESGGTSATFRGGSQIVNCDGDVLFQAGKDECVAVVDISPGRARLKRNILCDD